MEDVSLEMKQEPDLSSVATDFEEKEVSGSQKEECADIRSVLIVGAGPAGLMLAYVLYIHPLRQSSPSRSFLSLKSPISVLINSYWNTINPFVSLPTY
jgi:hypothetical protein